jgi:hypothetical protein
MSLQYYQVAEVAMSLQACQMKCSENVFNIIGVRGGLEMSLYCQVAEV